MSARITVRERDVARRLDLSSTEIPPMKRRAMLRKIMKENGLRGKDVAALIGYSQQGVRLWTGRSQRQIPQHMLIRIYELVGWDIDTGEPKRADFTG